MSKTYNFTTKTFDFAGRSYTFNGWDQDCRDGYNQFGELRISEKDVYGKSYYKLTEAKNHVINRSWEAYDHQAVYVRCVIQFMDFRRKVVTEAALAGMGRKRVSKSIGSKIDQLVFADELYKEAWSMLNSIK